MTLEINAETIRQAQEQVEQWERCEKWHEAHYPGQPVFVECSCVLRHGGIEQDFAYSVLSLAAALKRTERLKTKKRKKDKLCPYCERNLLEYPDDEMCGWCSEEQGGNLQR